MYQEICPCKDCNDRHTACHDKCEKYAEWKIGYNSYAQTIITGRRKSKGNGVDSYLIEKALKHRNREHRKGRQ